MNATIETDYLVIGAGASGMSLVDELVAHSDAEVLVVDRRHQPGGHWVDAYPFVRLHQPSAYYGVNSRPLGADRIDTHGINAGMYERASAAEICDYYQKVLADHLATGRVTFLGATSHVGVEGDAQVLASHIDGRKTQVCVRRRVIDATYVESVIPARHRRSFDVAEGARVIPPNTLVDLAKPASGFTVIGGGKTAMDVVCWLLDQRVDPDSIRWIRPRDGWLTDRRGTQPHQLAAQMAGYQADLVQAIAAASSSLGVLERMEAAGHLHRIDPTYPADIYRGATISAAELDLLRSIERVERGRRVRAIGRDSILLDDGELQTDPGQVHVDCTAQGLATSQIRPIYSEGRITVQFTTAGVAPWSAAIVGYVETLDLDDAERNRLCPVVPRTGLAVDQVRVFGAGFAAEGARRGNPDIAAWAARARLNPGRSIMSNADEPEVAQALARMMAAIQPATENLARIAAG